MKRCPKCKRTYADDAFTFCLEDGALLSAPYDPEKKEEPLNTIQSGGPPPTAVLPADSGSKETDTKPATLPSTIASPVISLGVPEAKPFVPPQFETNAAARQKSKLPYITISSLALVVLLGGIFVFTFKKAQCRNVRIHCGQSASDPSSAYCDLDFVKGIDNVTWSTSLGKIDSPDGGAGTIINTTGLSGRTISVTAKFTTDGWFCSNTATTSFVSQ